MAIEFRCTTCQRLLSTPDDTAGRRAKCPECGTVLTIPSASEPAPASGGMGTFPPPSGYPVQGPPPSSYDADNPYRSPSTYTPPPSSPFGGTPQRVFAPTRIEFGEVLSRTWAVYTSQFGMCLAIGLVGWIINVAANMGFSMVGTMFNLAAPGAGSFLSMVATWLFSTWIMVGIYSGFLKISRGERVDLGELFRGGPFWGRSLGAGLLYFVLCAIPVAIGFAIMMAASLAVLPQMRGNPAIVILIFTATGLVCFIPAVVLMLTFSQYQFLIIDRNLGAMESLGQSREITRGNRLTMLGILIVAGLLGALVVIFTCGLGLIAVVPYMFALYSVLYLSMTGQATIGRAPGGYTPGFSPGPVSTPFGS